ncbi:MAG: hypothetical protein A2268_03515 [Candidatus Raymondbacteria bacterium RifOxyA12_full_50_37]|uniref:Beta-glucuronidase n=1 Tax=Candidatus Raymondbacteria bacterium RIFOXYD12_FULL_49_13 TaxID=1817890 RepID=A0A1F7F3S8_UNCRA|nr:MAG: hypothetical protein A2268_03515 [Candidatus Raymondbacteria bacterium RifOxyA12_full_50_37]OGJ88381.1 MAG: hypothetical protein A2248_00895 [Candidatus Raymondbacteria bacterium RIFOXYA2_FULL_49_16]OGJ96219.1 MAG: hypothetical protein A2453_08625 [Candidatus Raymondbacteria bacterium RIFOXYC2_FULL_50_21]OGK01213.1 MAG: hypothetical protein A2519_22435 [Candidatus Raymondbacteria bacterium RIFOXYD12_FULL_49_13]OGP41346.1 MAG: hypothetical protein A2324_01495 [Candidatus Raymondbacteria 
MNGYCILLAVLMISSQTLNAADNMATDAPVTVEDESVAASAKHENPIPQGLDLKSLQTMDPANAQTDMNRFFNTKRIEQIHNRPASLFNGFLPGRRTGISLAGPWKMVQDVMGAGFRRKFYMVQPWDPHSNNPMSTEVDWDHWPEIQVPGSFTTQRENLKYYSGYAWYKRSFDFTQKNGNAAYLVLEGVNYAAKIWLNGSLAGESVGGYLPIVMDITKTVKPQDNQLVVMVDNRILDTRVPPAEYGWNNWGGIIRDVILYTVPEKHIQDYHYQFALKGKNEGVLDIIVQASSGDGMVRLGIPGLVKARDIQLDKTGQGRVSIPVKKVRLWSPQDPFLHTLTLSYGTDVYEDKIGLRTLSIKGRDLFLNGAALFLKGISLHDEPIGREGRVVSRAEADALLKQVKDLNGNFARLAHYPHSQHTVYAADSLGIILWEEIPVYWQVRFDLPETFEDARNQLIRLIQRDKNRVSCALWSVTNETWDDFEFEKDRHCFTMHLAELARSLDPSRWVTAAGSAKKKGHTLTLKDHLFEFLDVIGLNEYYGWYDENDYTIIDSLEWEPGRFKDKPVIISEVGAEGIYGLRGSITQKWTEDYQAEFYKHHLNKLKTIPFVQGISPWILKDFNEPRRLSRLQNGYNRKGIIDEYGKKKMAFDVLKGFYQTIQ